MSTVYTRKWLDTDGRNSSCKSFTIYNGQLVFYDPGPLATDGQIIGTSDGETFASILDIDSAVSGIDGQGDTDGISLAIYNGNLFISQGTGPGVNDARVLEWDGSSLTQHLKSVLQNNTWSYSLIVWGRKLWLITDQTSGLGNHRRVVYEYDGSTWTAIVDYDGAAYLDYNVGAGLPGTDIRHLTSKLFVYANRLYLLATRYNSGTAQWNWQSWILNTNGTEFNKLSDIDAGYVFSSVSNFEGTVYIVSNTISAGGIPQNPAKVYSTTDMTNFSLMRTIADLGFPFGEAAFNNKLFINCLILGTGNTEIKYLDRLVGSFTVDGTITTNTSIHQSGDLISFKGSLLSGKWKEVYKRVAVLDGEEIGEKVTVPVIRTRWKNPLGLTVFRHYSPLDTRSPTIFYSGKIMSMSGGTRAVDDNTGLPIFNDITIEFDNSDKEFSILLASYEIKNQIIETYHGWDGGLHADLQLITRLIVISREIKGPMFVITARDPATIYFNKKIPFHMLTLSEFPNIHPDVIGDRAPEILGLNSKTAGENPGSQEARLTDQSAHEYIAAYRTLYSISQVYSSNGLKTVTTDYVITYRDGYTFITFVSSQGENKITFNCAGYAVAGWNSVNGYVQNLAYITLFFLNQIMEIPAELIDYEAADALALVYDNLGEGEAGKLSLPLLRDPKTVLAELTFSGFTLYRDPAGRFVMKMKDISDFAESIFIFDQIDALQPSENLDSSDEIVNHAKVEWDFHTAPAQYESSKVVSRQSSIDLHGPEQEPKASWGFPWITSESLIDIVTNQKLLKYAFGNKRKKIILSIRWIRALELLKNIQFQDPYGISLDGSGDVGRRYYIESILPDLQGQTVEIIAADLQWLLQQYFIVGDEAALPATWPAATIEQRLYAFACDESTGKFSDGEPGKIAIDENLII